MQVNGGLITSSSRHPQGESREVRKDRHNSVVQDKMEALMYYVTATLSPKHSRAEFMFGQALRITLKKLFNGMVECPQFEEIARHRCQGLATKTLARRRMTTDTTSRKLGLHLHSPDRLLIGAGENQLMLQVQRRLQ